jgi:DNA invertase Pin-like site-specific DNA recombinase
VGDKRLLKLIRAFLRVGVMEDGLVSPVDEGTPQGGPLSPLLSNIVLDELDRELERRGLRFARYADDCNIYVRSRRGVALISVAESLDTSSAAGRLVINIMTAVSQWEREAIGERTRDAMRHKRSNGERVGNIAYGFRLAADGEHLEPDPGEQAVVSRVQQLRPGHSLRGIAAKLNEDGFRTRRGTPWRLESVVRVARQLSNV